MDIGNSSKMIIYLTYSNINLKIQLFLPPSEILCCSSPLCWRRRDGIGGMQITWKIVKIHQFVPWKQTSTISHINSMHLSISLHLVRQQDERFWSRPQCRQWQWSQGDISLALLVMIKIYNNICHGRKNSKMSHLNSCLSMSPWVCMMKLPLFYVLSPIICPWWLANS